MDYQAGSTYRPFVHIVVRPHLLSAAACRSQSAARKIEKNPKGAFIHQYIDSSGAFSCLVFHPTKRRTGHISASFASTREFCCVLEAIRPRVGLEGAKPPRRDLGVATMYHHCFSCTFVLGGILGRILRLKFLGFWALQALLSLFFPHRSHIRS